MSKLALPYTRDCFVCGAHNPHGLRLRFRREGDEVRADFTPQTQHAGFRGIVHGGILSTVLDEAMFWPRPRPRNSSAWPPNSMSASSTRSPLANH